MTETIFALAPTKKRNAIGMVGVEIDADQRLVYVRLAKQWNRENMADIAPTVNTMFKKIKWDTTYADQLVGQHLLKDIEYKSGINIFAINTQKNIKEPEAEEGIKRMDQTEISQFFLSLKLIHKIQFPKTTKTQDMLNLIQQTEMFKEVTTEQGSVSYYGPGDEFDCLIKALMICCFAGRILLEQNQTPFMIVSGGNSSNDNYNTPEGGKNALKNDMEKTMNNLLGNKKRKTNPLGYSGNNNNISSILNL